MFFFNNNNSSCGCCRKVTCVRCEMNCGCNKNSDNHWGGGCEKKQHDCGCRKPQQPVCCCKCCCCRQMNGGMQRGYDNYD